LFLGLLVNYLFNLTLKKLMPRECFLSKTAFANKKSFISFIAALIMQIALVIVTFLLAVLLYRMLNSRRTTYPYVKVTRRFVEGEEDYTATEHEHGHITIDHDLVIIEGHEYNLKAENGHPAVAYLKVEAGKLISVNLILPDGEKEFFIDPEYSIFTVASYNRKFSDKHSHTLCI
jgi:uncharacterized protein YxeA